jgi:S1-C subfamily serine protease
MKLLAGLLLAALMLSSWAAEKMTSVTVDGVSYLQIQDAHIASGGRVVLLYPSGGTMVQADKLPKAFLDSWGITAEKLDAAKAASERQSELEIDQAIRAGMFREVEGEVYDLRKLQAAWTHLTGAKILQISPAGALADPSPGKPDPTPIFIRNLPGIYTDNDTVSVIAKATGPFSYINRFGYERTVRSYDAGRACTRKEIPEAMLKDGLAYAPVIGGPKPGSDRGLATFPDHTHLRAIGSGFFVTKDGYLLTNHHVVQEARKIEVKYRGQTYQAKVAAEDETNDLAVLKVEGADFESLSISPKPSVDLGQEVFTIGFPNIQAQGVEPKYTDGKISSLKGMQDDPSEYQISVPVQPGNSGGPLCDVNGQVVGVIVARLNDLAMLEAVGVVPQNVNYAVKVSHALRLLQNIKGLTPTPAQSSKPENAVKTVENAIAMVMIY